MLVNSKFVLDKANKGRYAVPSFNVSNLETLQAVMAGALKMKSPVILQTSEGAIEYAGLEYLAAIVKVAAQGKLPVVLHLDHGKSLSMVKACLAAGYTSVMIDASDKSYSQNFKLTREVVKLAHRRKVSVEAELGAIAGIEDFVNVSERDAHFTNPEMAWKFVKGTGCDCLGVAIGTSHGAYKFSGAPRLDIERLKEIKKLVKIPLALHGASSVPSYIVKLGAKYGEVLGKVHGNSDKEVAQAIKFGINKVNIDTDLRLAFTAGVRMELAANPGIFDPRKILQPAKDLITQVVVEKIKLFGSAGQI